MRVDGSTCPGSSPAIVLDEFVACEAAVRADPRWQDAMRKRGVTDPSLTMMDPWSAGNFGFPGEEGRRLVRALTWVRRHASDNGVRAAGGQPAHRRST